MYDCQSEYGVGGKIRTKLIEANHGKVFLISDFFLCLLFADSDRRVCLQSYSNRSVHFHRQSVQYDPKAAVLQAQARLEQGTEY